MIRWQETEHKESSSFGMNAWNYFVCDRSFFKLLSIMWHNASEAKRSSLLIGLRIKYCNLHNLFVKKNPYRLFLTVFNSDGIWKVEHPRGFYGLLLLESEMIKFFFCCHHKDIYIPKITTRSLKYCRPNF